MHAWVARRQWESTTRASTMRAVPGSGTLWLWPSPASPRARSCCGTRGGCASARSARTTRPLVALFDRLGRDTVYQRFFTAKKRLPPDWARRLATVDYGRRLALVAEHDAGDGPELVGVARWDPTDDPATAEVAVVVEDRWQNQGLGTALLADLLRTAGARGISRFRAWVLADNARMLRLLARVAEVRERHTRRGVTELLLTRRDAGGPGGPAAGA